MNARKNDLIIVWYEADYKNNYPVLNPFDLSDEEQIIKSLIIKSDIWIYEGEIRFILFTYPNKELTLPYGIIDQIILGCKICKDDRKAIIEFSKNNHIELIQAYRKENDFGLGFIKVNV